MFLLIVGWAMLWFRPAWWFWSGFSLCYAALTGFIYYVRAANDPQSADLPMEVVLLAAAIDTVVGVAIFAAVGAIIVVVRTRRAKPGRKEAEIDAELARMRAEAAARETPPHTSASVQPTEAGPSGLNPHSGSPHA